MSWFSKVFRASPPVVFGLVLELIAQGYTLWQHGELNVTALLALPAFTALVYATVWSPRSHEREVLRAKESGFIDGRLTPTSNTFRGDTGQVGWSPLVLVLVIIGVLFLVFVGLKVAGLI